MRQKTKQSTKGPLVAIDVGSYAIRAIAAEQNADHTLRILGVETIQKTRAIQKGIVTNSSEIGTAIGKILALLKNRIGMRSNETIQAAFVSLGGHQLQSTIVEAKRDQLSYNYISEKRLQEMQKECKEKLEDKYPEFCVFHLEPILYILDNEPQTDKPTDRQKARYITVKYNAFVATRINVERLEGAFDRANVGIEHTFAKPDVLVTALCTEQEMEDGVAIIDFGYQTTTLTIYKGNAFRLTYVAPRGGYHLSRDIQDMQISFEHAEQAKERFGNALEESVTKTQTLNIPNVKNPTERVQLSTALLARIIEAQLDETLEPIFQRLRAFQAGDTLSQIYITGGGAMLKNIVPYLQKKTSIPVEYGSHAAWLDLDSEEFLYQPDYTALIGTLILGADYRITHPDVEPPKTKFGEGFTQLIIGLFTDEQN